LTPWMGNLGGWGIVGGGMIGFSWIVQIEKQINSQRSF